jgi:hypothetical protein
VFCPRDKTTSSEAFLVLLRRLIAEHKENTPHYTGRDQRGQRIRGDPRKPTDFKLEMPLISTQTWMPLIFPPNAPELPQFKALVVKGAYHASAPVHFCLSVTDASCVLITPCRRKFATALEEFDDAWLKDKGGNGFVAGTLSRTKL